MTTTATVTWQHDGNADLFQIKIICSCPNREPEVTKGTVFPHPGDNTYEFDDMGLKPGCTYYYKICALLFRVPNADPTMELAELTSDTLSAAFGTSMYISGYFLLF